MGKVAMATSRAGITGILGMREIGILGITGIKRRG
jgi:hypothetical protein